MDLALRRRFKFREIEPNPELLNWVTVAWIDIKELFITLNKRIEFLYDRDHLLGHAYFLPLKKDNSLEKLNSIMLDNIVPLLQEYFHDDWEKIQLVLWDWIVKSEMMSAKELWINNSEYEDYPKYVINTHLSAQDYPH
jgi:5-methylcytosine-specific restriction protein B